MGMPVVLVNPRKKRVNKRRNARRKRRNPRRARAGSLARRRNPRVRSMKEGAIGGLLSSLGGVVAYGLHFGSSYAPVGNIGQTLILAGAGTVTSIGTAWFADDRAAWGIMGGTIALVTGRLHAQWALGAMVKKKAAPNGADGVYTRGAGAPIPAFTGRLRPGAGVVVPRGAAAMMNQQGQVQPAVATTSHRMGFAGGETFKVPVSTPGVTDAGASRYIPGNARWFGPQSWAYDAGKVFRSAHDVR